MGMSKDKKVDYFARTKNLVKTFSKVFVVTVSKILYMSRFNM